MVEQDPDAIHPELVIRMMSKKPGWKDNNFQVRQHRIAPDGILGLNWTCV